ncbi:MAG: hypothetical protein HY558_00010 [Euryarchaeota archaeon]|nr:hypothetical protein [Euryarchaeota archaeon]
MILRLFLWLVVAMVLLLSGCGQSPGAVSTPSPIPVPSFHREQVSPVSTQDIEEQCRVRLPPRDYEEAADAPEAYLFADSSRQVRVVLRYPRTMGQFREDRRAIEALAGAANLSLSFEEVDGLSSLSYRIIDRNTTSSSVRFLKGGVEVVLSTGGVRGSPENRAASPPACTPAQMVELAQVAYGRV